MTLGQKILKSLGISYKGETINESDAEIIINGKQILCRHERHTEKFSNDRCQGKHRRLSQRKLAHQN